jgi:predicted transcriptional regulator
MQTSERLVLKGNKVITIQNKKPKAVYRSENYVTHQILTVLSKEKPIASVVVRYCQISFIKAKEFLEKCCDDGLLTKTENGEFKNYNSFKYNLTLKGFELLKTLDNYSESLKKFNLEL